MRNPMRVRSQVVLKSQLENVLDALTSARPDLAHAFNLVRRAFDLDEFDGPLPPELRQELDDLFGENGP